MKAVSEKLPAFGFMIHYFNPGHETAVLNSSKYYMAPANVVKMQHDLSFLPAWYASKEDYVLVDEDFPFGWYSGLNNQIRELPAPVKTQDIIEDPDKFMCQEVCLWGITPQAIHSFEEINKESNLNFQLPVWKEEYKQLNSRATSKKCLQYIIDKTGKFPDSLVPVFFSTLQDIEKHIVENNTIQYLAKAPFSSSGRGLLWLPKGELTRTERQILHGHLKKQGAVSLEKALDKKLDLALEFYAGKNSVRFEGISLFKTNGKGAYMGNYLYTQERMKEEIKRFINFSFVEAAKETLSDYLTTHIAPYYNGYIGVDMLIYKERGNYFLHPCLEINLRNNMGVLALRLQKNVLAENSTGMFHIDFDAKEKAIFLNHMKLEESNPAVFKDGRIVSGYLPLCPVREGNKYNAYLLVEQG